MMFQAVVLVLAFALLNRLRGSDVPFTSKGITSAVSGLAAGGCAFWLGYATGGCRGDCGDRVLGNLDLGYSRLRQIFF